MAEYKVQFEIFEGPLDLLLYLVRKEEVDIYDLNLTRIATQFIEYIELMRELDLEVAGEFLVMASTLMLIKSKELLPVDQQAPADAEDDAGDPRWELIRQLFEYKKFKDAGSQFQQREARQENIFHRQPAKPEFASPPTPARTEVSLFDLINAVSVVLKRFKTRSETREIVEDKWSVSEKIELLRRTLMENPRVKFFELFAASTSRAEVVVTFLALLELIRLKYLAVTQSAAFGEIEIARVMREPEPVRLPAPELLPPAV